MVFKFFLEGCMIKWILALIIMNSSIFAGEYDSDLVDCENEALFHIANGNDHLFMQEPLRALEEFENAKSVLDRTGDFQHPINFLITFSKIIAYDCLGSESQCRESVGSLFLRINENNDEREEYNIQSEEENEKSKMIISFLRNLAVLSPSSQVRELLFSLIEDMENQLLPTFEFAQSSFLENEGFSFNKNQNQFSLDQCKSLWNRLRKWTTEFADWVYNLYKVCRGINDIKKAYNEWKKESSHNLSYEEFRQYYNQRYNN